MLCPAGWKRMSEEIEFVLPNVYMMRRDSTFKGQGCYISWDDRMPLSRHISPHGRRGVADMLMADGETIVSHEDIFRRVV